MTQRTTAAPPTIRRLMQRLGGPDVRLAVAYEAGPISHALHGREEARPASRVPDDDLELQGGSRPMSVPAQAAPAMTQPWEREGCGCDSASVGGVFCPACGHSSARTTFQAALVMVRALMELADRIPAIVEGRDAAADAARHLAEDSLVRAWTSFRRFARATPARRSAHPARATNPVRRNALQDPEASDGPWTGAIGHAGADFLTPAEHRDLVRLVQARHVLVHQDGLVSADYVARSGDHRYAVGQRLVVTPGDVRRLSDLTEKLAVALEVAVLPRAHAWMSEPSRMSGGQRQLSR